MVHYINCLDVLTIVLHFIFKCIQCLVTIFDMLSEAWNSLNEVYCVWLKCIFLHLYLVLFMVFEVESISSNLFMLASASIRHSEPNVLIIILILFALSFVFLTHVLRIPPLKLPDPSE